MLILPANSLTGGYEIDYSTNLGDNAYYTRTPVSAGNQKTWTWSAWIKRSKISSSNETIFGVQSTTTANQLQIYFGSNDTLSFYHYSSSGGVTDSFLGTNQVFRDISAWYHLVIAVDTTQATSSNRVKIYLNGSQITSFSTAIYFNLNYNTYVNATNQHRIGVNSDTVNFFNGYMSEINFIDGQALDPTSFGKFDQDSGIWKPIEYTGTYGMNGFFLNFATRATDPIDASGNGNNWSSVNVISTDWKTDTPTNNYATLNALDKSGGVLSEGNNKFTSDGGWDGVRSTIAFPSNGKWYAELFVNSRSTGVTVGVLRTDRLIVGDIAADSGGYIYNSGDGNKYNNGSNFAYGATWGTNDIIGIAWDSSVNSITFYKNGVSQGVAWTGLSGEYSLAVGVNGSDSASINFGNPPFTISSGNSDANGYGNFEYSVPSGYYALNTKNLAEFG